MPIGSNDVTAEEAQAIADQVLAVDGVSGMHSGNVGEVAMLFPGARVAGLRIREGALQVHVTADPEVVVLDGKGATGDDIFADLGNRIRDAIGTRWDGAIDVFVGDIRPAENTEADQSDQADDGELDDAESVSLTSGTDRNEVGQ